jgi:hypothetical protein
MWRREKECMFNGNVILHTSRRRRPHRSLHYHYYCTATTTTSGTKS